VSITDGLLIASTLLSPLIAVRVSAFLDRAREDKGRKEWIYKTLMATRANALAPAHVEALNRISFEFSAQSPKEKLVLDAWAGYLNHLGQQQDGNWGSRRVDLMIDLLQAMGNSLGYEFNKTEIRTGIYLPTAHDAAQLDQLAIRQMTVEMLRGDRPIPVKVVPQEPPKAATPLPP
jgi:hypothetical protein